MEWTKVFFCILLILQVTTRVKAFSKQPKTTVVVVPNKHEVQIERWLPETSRRRQLLHRSISLVPLLVPMASRAVMMKESDQTKTFKAGEAMGAEDALLRFQEAKNDLQYLVDNYDTIVAKGGGDNVRRYLGTVGVTSNLYGIGKVMKELQDEADDIVEYTENMNEFDAALRAADTACYSANFVEFSAAKTKPEKFFEDAFLDIGNMMKAMDNMTAELKVK